MFLHERLEGGKVMGQSGRELLTFIKTVDAATLRELVCTDDTSEDCEKTAGDPPSNRIT